MLVFNNLFTQTPKMWQSGQKESVEPFSFIPKEVLTKPKSK